MATDKKPSSSENKSISINGDVRDSTVIAGDNNVVNKTTIIQKFFNIFKSDSETLEQRNRRILLNHVENAWIKGVLDASLHGAALLDLGIKEDPEAVTKYPWTLKKESTDEALPAGTSMLEIFDSIGMGRSLLILGAPGSGKTTMLLELARGLIARAREDVTQPIPMVFNLASWTEKLTLADWLAQELNNLYSVPRKTAPDWVKGNKLLLLLDGLDEVRQDSRAKCVEAINAFRKQNGLTSLAVCSRSQDYADLNAKLSFEGAIEVQPLTQEQVAEFFNRFGDEMAGIKQALEKDSGLREMAETPLFLSIMIMAYRDKQATEILASVDEKERRKHLFDTYIERMFERRPENTTFQKQDIVRWLLWLANKMVIHNEIPFFLENMQFIWFYEDKRTQQHEFASKFMFGQRDKENKIATVDLLSWNWSQAGHGMKFGIYAGVIAWVLLGLDFGVTIGLCVGLSTGIYNGLIIKRIEQTIYPEQRLFLTAQNFRFTALLFGCAGAFMGGVVTRQNYWQNFGETFWLLNGLFTGLLGGVLGGLNYGGSALVQHYILRYRLARNNLLPWRLVPFLDHCVDLIFLRRVGGGYIFIHRLLMEHFAEMYVETPTSKRN